MFKFLDKNVANIDFASKEVEQIYFENSLVWEKSQLILTFKDGTTLNLGRPKEMLDYEFRPGWNGSKTSVNNPVVKVDMANSVIRMGAHTLRRNKIDEFYMTDSIEEAGEYFLAECGIKKIRLSESLQKLPRFGLYGNEFDEIYVPDSVRTIDEYCLHENSRLKTIYIKKGTSYSKNGWPTGAQIIWRD